MACIRLTAAPSNEAAPSCSDDPEFLVAVNEATARHIDRLIQALASPKYSDRYPAVEQLAELGIAAFPRLRAAYHDSHDFEVRSQIEAIVRRAYITHHVFARFGFLGISQDRWFVPTHDDEPMIPEGQSGIIIRGVIPNTGAERAGVIEGDIILAIDGHPIVGFGEQAVEWVGRQIRERGPGGIMELLLLRERVHLVTVAATLTAPPERVLRGEGQGTLPYFPVLLARAEARFPAWWLKHFGRHGEQNEW